MFCFKVQPNRTFSRFIRQYFAGGQPSAISIKQNLEKEAFEEAGIKILEKDLTIGNTFSYIHNHDHQIHSGTIFVYDYKIDQNIVLKNYDGEVQKFETICATEIDRILEKKLLKPNCIIPIADFFLRNMRDFFPNNSILELERVLKKK